MTLCLSLMVRGRKAGCGKLGQGLGDADKRVAGQADDVAGIVAGGGQRLQTGCWNGAGAKIIAAAIFDDLPADDEAKIIRQALRRGRGTSGQFDHLLGRQGQIIHAQIVEQHIGEIVDPRPFASGTHPGSPDPDSFALPCTDRRWFGRRGTG